MNTANRNSTIAVILSALALWFTAHSYVSAAVTTNGTASITASYSFDNVMGKMTGALADGRVTVTNGTTGESLRQTGVAIDGSNNVTGIQNCGVLGNFGVNGTSALRGTAIDGVLYSARREVLFSTGANGPTQDQSGAMLLYDATGAAVAPPLPTNPLDGTWYTFKKVDGSANTVTVTAQGTDVIDGGTTYVLGATFDAVTVVYYASARVWNIAAVMP